MTDVPREEQSYKKIYPHLVTSKKLKLTIPSSLRKPKQTIERIKKLRKVTAKEMLVDVQYCADINDYEFIDSYCLQNPSFRNVFEYDFVVFLYELVMDRILKEWRLCQLRLIHEYYYEDFTGESLTIAQRKAIEYKKKNEDAENDNGKKGGKKSQTARRKSTRKRASSRLSSCLQENAKKMSSESFNDSQCISPSDNCDILNGDEVSGSIGNYEKNSDVSNCENSVDLNDEGLNNEKSSVKHVKSCKNKFISKRNFALQKIKKNISNSREKGDKYCGDADKNKQLSFKKYRITNPIEDNSTSETHLLCDICTFPETSQQNIILTCNGCLINVHQECYGVPNLEKYSYLEDVKHKFFFLNKLWFCRKCLFFPEDNPKCKYCPVKGNAFKMIYKTKRWAHILCAKFIENIGFANTVFLEPIEELKEENGEKIEEHSAKNNLNFFGSKNARKCRKKAENEKLEIQVDDTKNLKEGKKSTDFSKTGKNTNKRHNSINVQNTEKEKEKEICFICTSFAGRTAKCNYDECTVKYHVTCGINFGLYFDTKNNTTFCQQHNPEILQDKHEKIQANSFTKLSSYSLLNSKAVNFNMTRLRFYPKIYFRPQVRKPLEIRQPEVSFILKVRNMKPQFNEFMANRILANDLCNFSCKTINCKIECCFNTKDQQNSINEKLEKFGFCKLNSNNLNPDNFVLSDLLQSQKIDESFESIINAVQYKKCAVKALITQFVLDIGAYYNSKCNRYYDTSGFIDMQKREWEKWDASRGIYCCNKMLLNYLNNLQFKSLADCVSLKFDPQDLKCLFNVVFVLNKKVLQKRLQDENVDPSDDIKKDENIRNDVINQEKILVDETLDIVDEDKINDKNRINDVENKAQNDLQNNGKSISETLKENISHSTAILEVQKNNISEQNSNTQKTNVDSHVFNSISNKTTSYSETQNIDNTIDNETTDTTKHSVKRKSGVKQNKNHINLYHKYHSLLLQKCTNTHIKNFEYHHLEHILTSLKNLKTVLHKVIQKKNEETKMIRIQRQHILATKDYPTFIKLHLIEKLQETESFEVFKYPVTEKIAPRYFSIIKHPMCFENIEDKLFDKNYTFDMMLQDLKLISDNCRAYNKSNNFFVNLANLLDKKVDEIVHQYD
ncbi:hypothetical protein EDEG_03555 [Edhazardia aedis USNM 41457]|uniref:Bromo domain-containing protein n=1 Tax=Edhazardia aedis (strain USNM 41457) TaxID=1003232 RepID=J9DKS8_EDHAE|nr:hypothetical protein EDEG_03555 [Edhazardia aedis USNM 41457]|eukprot:EJW01992.1 hypothetical protein EDEG_03555 [Edhazardia aedis USNM 41457]